MDIDGKDKDTGMPRSQRQPPVSGNPSGEGILEEGSPQVTGETAGDEAAGESTGADGAESESLEKERDEWKAKATSYWDQFLRARAEMENFRKRTERDIEQRVNRGKSDLILALLDVLDNFDRFLAAGEKDATENEDSGFAAFFKGAQLIQRQILDVLAREGVEPIEDSVGKTLDPHYHEAVFAQDGGGEHGTIVQEIQKGYKYNGSVLRPSRVKVIR